MERIQRLFHHTMFGSLPELVIRDGG